MKLNLRPTKGHSLTGYPESLERAHGALLPLPLDCRSIVGSGVESFGFCGEECCDQSDSVVISSVSASSSSILASSDLTSSR